MAEEKAKYRDVTLRIRDDESFEDVVEKLRSAYGAEEWFKSVVNEPTVSVEDLLNDLDVVLREEKAAMDRDRKLSA